MSKPTTDWYCLIGTGVRSVDSSNKVDINNDGKIDRWELYTYCMHNMTPE